MKESAKALEDKARAIVEPTVTLAQRVKLVCSNGG